MTSSRYAIGLFPRFVVPRVRRVCTFNTPDTPCSTVSESTSATFCRPQDTTQSFVRCQQTASSSGLFPLPRAEIQVSRSPLAPTTITPAYPARRPQASSAPPRSTKPRSRVNRAPVTQSSLASDRSHRRPHEARAGMAHGPRHRCLRARARRVHSSWRM